MSKRMAVVPEELATSYFSKTPDARLHDIESKIENLLHASSYSDDAKAKLLSQLILKYWHMVSEPKPPVRVTIEEEIPKEKSAEVAERNISEDCTRYHSLCACKFPKIHSGDCGEIENTQLFLE
ncbi:uncharacterized protein TNCT_106871 [Trichonephila clavata]|uniref:Uncharacterized protein n=1 Tax=Trichonephila clavata TaxID=2740835 RepID=A0A8X6K8F9_TRICU|nr:uncharacterized protein TNCT_106871 [Trichonephila clavata]